MLHQPGPIESMQPRLPNELSPTTEPVSHRICQLPSTSNSPVNKGLSRHFVRLRMEVVSDRSGERSLGSPLQRAASAREIPLGGQAFCQIRNRRLRRVVEHLKGNTYEAGSAQTVSHMATSSVEDTEDVDIVYLPEVFVGEIDGRLGRRNTRVLARWSYRTHLVINLLEQR
ncbi:hypothetical protein LshimejAT787_0700230 [Lyophyllum shimeji]|uniref:Uncharacterized protein n=1 Tax=Lyophyllum shimeji TaxID=47721 RepID=A0A9P3PQ34_LYOSH|nr:hypothetical protein LshimejAT787_0700230 [Lyophyllum shimeji]